MLANTAEDPIVEIPAPAADWTPEQQIAHMLDLCEAQIEAALSESDLAVDALIKSFADLVETTRAGVLANNAPAPKDAGANDADTISKQMASAVVAFQFYDKLTQRLGHVRYSLSTLALFVCDRSQTSQRDQWKRLFSTLRRLYRTEEERQIFQLMVEGVSAEDARSQAQQTTQSLRRGPTGEIELF
ncbi:MAG: hypothetical protein ACREV5_09770 [Steroidobacter sp.]